MRIGKQSKDLLEIFLLLGIEFAEGVLTHPSVYRCSSSSSEQSFRRTIQLLKRNGWLDVDDSDPKGQWVGNITNDGRKLIPKVVDPSIYWDQVWDGKWRIFTFDLPAKANAERKALRKWLVGQKFGKLQGSVWITPRDLGDWSVQLSKINVDPSEFVYISGDFGGTNKNADYINRAWDFGSINEKYSAYENFIAAHDPETASPESFNEWFQKERSIWEDAFESDPFLPRSLWTKDFENTYRGIKAYELQKNAYLKWKEKLR